MSEADLQHVSTAARLRAAFDRAFAEAPRGDVEATDDLLALTLGSDPYALRLSEVAGLFADRPVTPLPGSMPQLVGLVGLKGAVLPVYDLRALVGYPSGGRTRWLVTTAGRPLALAFDRFDGHLRVSRHDVAPATAAANGKAGTFVREIARGDGWARPVIDLPAVVARIEATIRAARPKE